MSATGETVKLREILKVSGLHSVPWGNTCIENKQSIPQIPAHSGWATKSAAKEGIAQRNETCLKSQNKISHILQWPSLIWLKGSGHPTANLTQKEMARKSKNNFGWGVYKEKLCSMCWVTITSLQSLERFTTYVGLHRGFLREKLQCLTHFGILGPSQRIGHTRGPPCLWNWTAS